MSHPLQYGGSIFNFICDHILQKNENADLMPYNDKHIRHTITDLQFLLVMTKISKFAYLKLQATACVNLNINLDVAKKRISFKNISRATN